MKRRQWCGAAVEWSKRTCVMNREISFSTNHYHQYNHQMGMTSERAKFKAQCSFDWVPGIHKAFIVPLDRDCWRRIDKYDISFLNPLTFRRDLMMMAWYSIQYLCHRSKLNTCNSDCFVFLAYIYTVFSISLVS